MSHNIWRRWVSQLFRRSVRKRVRNRPRRRLEFEFLEDRVVPATDIWTGLGGTANPDWSFTNNWNLGRAPIPGDDIVFNSATAPNLATIDNVALVPGTSFDSISIQAPGYSIGGAAKIILSGALNAGANLGGIGGVGTGPVISTPIEFEPPANNPQQTVTVGGGTLLDISGIVSGSSSAETVFKSGTGTLELDGNDSGYTGGWILNTNGGIVLITNGDALGTGTLVTGEPNAGIITVNANAQLQVQGGISVPENLILNGPGFNNDGAILNVSGNNTWTGLVQMQSNSLFGSNSGNLTFANTISDSGAGFSATKVGYGTVTFATANTYHGQTIIDNGILAIENPLSLGAGANSTDIQSGTTGSETIVNYNGSNNTFGTLEMEYNAASAPILASNPNAILNSNGTVVGFQVFNDLLVINGPGADPLAPGDARATGVFPDAQIEGLTQNHIGALYNLSGNNGWDGGVTLGSVTSSAADPITSYVVNIPGVGLTLEERNDVFVGAAANTNLTIAGALSNGNTAPLLDKVQTGRVILTDANTYTGGTEVDEGDLEITDSNALGSGDVVVGDTYVWERTDADPSDKTPIQPIGGSWSINSAAAPSLEMGVDSGLDGTAQRTEGRNLGFDSFTGSGWGLSDNILQDVYVPGASTGSVVTFKLTFTYDGVTSSTTQKANVGAVALQTALNGLTSIKDAGGVTVTESGDTYIVLFDATSTTASTIPLMTINTAIPNAEVTPATNNGINALQEIVVPTSNTGGATTFIMTFSYQGSTYSTLPLTASTGAANLQSKLNALQSIISVGGVTVTQSGDIYYVLFNSTTNNIPLLSINTSLAGAAVVPATDVQELSIPGSSGSTSSGSFSVSFNYSGTTSSTPLLAYNITAANLQTALNALTSIASAGGVEVTQDGNVYRVYFNSTTLNVPLMTLGSNTTVANAAVNPVYGLIVANPIIIGGTGLNNEGALNSLSGINTYIGPIVIGNNMANTASIDTPPLAVPDPIDEAVFTVVPAPPHWTDVTAPTQIPVGSLGAVLDSRPGHATADNSYLTYDYKLTIPIADQMNSIEFYAFDKFGTGQIVIANSNEGIKGPTTIEAGWITAEANDVLGPATVDPTLSELLQPDYITIDSGASLQLLPEPGQSITLGNNFILSGLGVPATTPAVPGINFHMLTEGSILSLGGDNLLTGTIQLDGTGSIGVDDPVSTDLAQQSILTVTGEIEDYQVPGGGTVPGGLDKLGERELIVQGPGTYTGSNVIVSGTLLLQNDTGLGLDTSGTYNPNDPQDTYTDTTTSVETGGLLELGVNNPTENGGLASSVQVTDENLALYGGGQQLNISGTGGTFKLTVTDPNTGTKYPTGQISVTSANLATAIQSAINAVLPAGDSVMVIPTVFGATGFVGLFTILFEGALANLANPLLAVTPGPAPGNATVTVSGSPYPVYSLEDNFWSGGVTLNEPVLPATSPPLANFNSNIEVANNSRLTIQGPIIDSSIAAANGSSMSLNTLNAITGVSAGTSADNGELVLSGSSSYRGNTYVNAGILTVANNQALGAPSMPEVQQIVVNQATGTFTLSFDGYTTVPINAASTTLASDIQNALNSPSMFSIAGVGGSVAVTKSLTQGGTFIVTFNGSLLGFQQNKITSSSPLTVIPSEVQAGYGGVSVSMGAQMQVEGNLTIAGKALELTGTGQSAANTPSQIPFTWDQIGPSPIDDGQTSGNNAVTGRVTGVATDPSDSNVIYISTAGGGAWRTINDGLTWTQLFDGIPEIQTITVNTTGSFTLTFNGKTVTVPGEALEPLVPLATQIETALDSLTSIGGAGGSVVVTQAGNVYTVTFGGLFTNTKESLITSTTAPALPTGSIVEIQVGAGANVAMYSGAIAVDPENVATIYLGTGEADNSGDSYYGTGVYVTHNYGETWALLTGDIFSPKDTHKLGNPLNGDAVSSIIVDPNWENTIYVSTSDIPANDPNALDGTAGAWRWSSNPASPDIGAYPATWTDLTKIVSLLRTEGAYIPGTTTPTDNPATGLLSIIAKLDTEPNVDPDGVLAPTKFATIALGTDYFGYGNPGEYAVNPATPGSSINIAELPEPYAPGIYDPISDGNFPKYAPGTPGPDDNWDVMFPVDGVYSSLAYGKASIPLLDLDFSPSGPNNFQIDQSQQNVLNNVPALYVALGDPDGFAQPYSYGQYDAVYRLLDPFDASADDGGLSTVWDVGDGNTWTISNSSNGDPSTLTIAYDSGKISTSSTTAGAFPMPFPNTEGMPPQYGFDAAGDPLPDSGNIKVTASGYSVYASITWADGNMLLNGNPEFEYLFASQNGGDSWVDPDPGLSNYMNTQGDYDSFIIAPPTSAANNWVTDTVFVGGCVSYGSVVPGYYTNQILESINGGAAFTDVSIDANNNANGPHTDEHAAAFDSNGDLIVGNDGGVWEYNIGTENVTGFDSWLDMNGNLSITTMNSVATATGDPTDVLAASQDNGTESSNPGVTGLTPPDGVTPPAWNWVIAGDGGDVAFDPQNSQIAYGMADGDLLKSTDGGQTFPIDILDVSAQLYFPYTIDPLNPNRLVAGGDTAAGLVFLDESNNQGATWNNLDPPAATVNAIALAEYQGEDGVNGTYVPDPTFPGVTDQGANTYVPGTIYITGIDPATLAPGIWVTKNDGLTWSPDRVGPNGNVVALAVNPLNQDNVFAVSQDVPGGANEVMESFDAGQTWVNITKTSLGGNLPNVPFWSIAIDPRTDTLYLGTGVGVYSAQMQSPANAGSKTLWTRFGQGLPNVEVTQLDLDMSTNTLSVSTYGRSIYQFDLNYPTANSGALDMVTGSAVWTGPVRLMGATTIEADGLQNFPLAQATLNIQGIISDGTYGADNTLTKTGLGTIIFSGANAYGGLTFVADGVLVANNFTALGASTADPAATVENGAALDLSANLDDVAIELIGNGLTFNNHYTGAFDNISGNNSFAGTIELDPDDSGVGSDPTVTIGAVSGTEMTLTGVISSLVDGPLVKEGTGTVVLDDSNTYQGTTYVYQGSLQAENSNAFAYATEPANAVDVIDGGQVQLQSPQEIQTLSITATSGTFQLAFGGQTTGVLSVSSVTLVSDIMNALNALSNIGGVGGVVSVVQESATLFEIFFGGTLFGQNVSPLTVPVADEHITVGSISAAVTQTGGPQVNVSNPLILSGTGVNGTGALESTGGSNTWSGPITFSTLAGFAPFTTPLGTVGLGATDLSTLTIAGEISDPGTTLPVSLLKVGAGEVVLQVVAPNTGNAYSGTTEVQAGILDIQNPSALGNRATDYFTTDFNTVQEIVTEDAVPTSAAADSAEFTIKFDGFLKQFKWGTSAAKIASAFNTAGTGLFAQAGVVGTVTVTQTSIETATQDDVPAVTATPQGFVYTITFEGAASDNNTPIIVAGINGVTTAASIVAAGGIDVKVDSNGSTAGELSLDDPAGFTVPNTRRLTLNGSGPTDTATTESLVNANGDGALFNYSGNNTWAGQIDLQTASEIGVATGTTLSLSNTTIPGNGTPDDEVVDSLTKIDPGTLIYTNGTTVSGVNLTVSNTNAFEVTPDGYTPQLSDIGETLVVTGGAGWTAGFYQILNVVGNEWVLSSSPAAVKTKGGDWTLYQSTGLFTGYTVVTAGDLQVDGYVGTYGGVAMNGGELSGTGTVGLISYLTQITGSAGTIDPGDNASGTPIGTLTSSGLQSPIFTKVDTLDSGIPSDQGITIDADIGASSSDQLNVKDAGVNLGGTVETVSGLQTVVGGATLTGNLNNVGIGTEYVVIETDYDSNTKDAVTGMFDGVTLSKSALTGLGISDPVNSGLTAYGATIDWIDNEKFIISYYDDAVVVTHVLASVQMNLSDTSDVPPSTTSTINYGENDQFTAELVPEAGAPPVTGQVQFTVVGPTSTNTYNVTIVAGTDPVTGDAVGYAVLDLTSTPDSLPEPLPVSSPGSYTISATYSGDNSFGIQTYNAIPSPSAPEPQSLTVTVQQATPTATLGATDLAPVSGEYDTLTANISTTVPLSEIVSSSGVNLAVDNVNDLAVTPDNYTPNSADIGKTLEITGGTNWTPGFYQITNVVGGEWVLSKSPAGVGTLGGQWTLFNTLVPSGTVTFYDTINGNTTAISGTVNYTSVYSTTGSYLQATITTAGVPVGTNYITQAYSGDSNYYPISQQNSPQITVVVNQDGTTTTVTASPDTSIYGQKNVTLTATVVGDTSPNHTYTSELPSPGTVSFLRIIGNTSIVLGTVSLDNTGTPGEAQLTLTPGQLPVAASGEYVTAVYNGDSIPDNFLSSSGQVKVFVDPDPTTTVVEPSSANPSVYGQPVTYSAEVLPNAPGFGTPTGTVDFYAGTVTAGVNLTVSNTNDLAVTPDSYTVSTADIGKTVDVTSGSPWSSGLYQIVGVANNQWVLNASPAAAGTANGQWSLFSTFLGSTTLNTSAVASYTPNAFDLPVGSSTISAVYVPGNGDFTTSNSNATSNNLTQVVSPDPTTTQITAPATGTSIVVGQQVTLTALVASQAPGAGNPTGNVSFYDYVPSLGGTPVLLGTVALEMVNAIDEANLNYVFKTPQGTHEIFAQFNYDHDDPDYVESSTQDPYQPISPTPPYSYITLNLGPDNSTVNVTSSQPSNSEYGQTVTFTATLIGASPGSGTPTGQVNFLSNGTPLNSSPINLVNGVATYATTMIKSGGSYISQLSEGSDVITVDYLGDSNYDPQNGTTTQIVNPDPTTTAVASNGPSSYGNPITFTATVNSNSPGNGNPLGTVNFYLAGSTTPLNSTPVSVIPVPGNTTSSTAVFATTANQLAVGTNQTITAKFTDTDGNFLGSTGTTSQTVNKGLVTVGLADSPSSSVYGQTVTLTATVTPNVGAQTPTGSVTFSEGTTVLASNVPLTLNATSNKMTASYQISTLPEGLSQTLTATYNSDNNYGTAVGTTLQSVNPDPTGITLSTLSSSINSGQVVLIFATVTSTTPGSGTPTGTVEFVNTANGNIGAATLVNGVAAYQISFSAPGQRVIQAYYTGSTDFSPSQKPYPTITENISAIGTRSSKVVVLSSKNPSFAGTPVTFTANVRDSGAGALHTPTGTVSFFDGATLLGYGTLTATSTVGLATAQFTTSTLPAGNNTITAAYNGNSLFTHSTSLAITQTVNAVPIRTSAVTLTSSATPIPNQTNSFTAAYGQTVKFSASVSDTGFLPAQNPSGNVTFMYSIPGSGTWETLGTATLSGTGATTTTSFSISTLSVGTYDVEAVYNGNSVFAAGSSASVTQTITVIGTSTTLISSTGAGSSTYGQSVTFTASVALNGGGPASGTVQFVNQTTNQVLGTVSLNNIGIATISTASLPVGFNNIEALYQGTTNSTASSNSLTQGVNQDNTTLTLAASTTQSNTSETFTANVKAASPGAGTPTGTVTFDIDNTNYYNVALVNGVATLTLPAGLSSGQHTINVIYSGDVDFVSSDDSIILNITNGRGT